MIQELAKFFDVVGVEWILWLLIGLSALSIGVIVERAIFFIKNGVDMDALSKRMLGALRDGGKDAAQKVAADVPGMPGGVLRAAFDAHDDGVDSMEEVIYAGIVRERTRYDRFLNILGTLGNNAPFIGLLGTVIGVIKAFGALDTGGALEMDQEMASDLMGAISEALVATAVGLAVAIPAVIGFNAYKTRIKSVAANTEWLARNVLAHLKAVGNRGDS